VRFTDNFGKTNQIFNGVDVSVNARLPRGVVLQGGTSTGKNDNTSCFVIDSPQRLRFCDNVTPYLTQIKFFTVIPLPWGVSASATYQTLPGPVITASYTASNAEIFPTLHRNLGSCRGAATCNGTVTFDLIQPNTQFAGRLHQVDARFAKTIRVGRTRLQGQFDLYNLLNANPVLGLNINYGPNWQNATQVLPGRLAKVGVSMNF
jgi:hypothetical protein